MQAASTASVKAEIFRLCKLELQGFAEAAGAKLSLKRLLFTDSRLELLGRFTVPGRILTIQVAYATSDPDASAPDEFLSMLKIFAKEQENSDESPKTYT